MTVPAHTIANLAAPAALLSSPPSLAARFLEPAGLRWGRFPAAGGASLRWAHLTAAHPGAEHMGRPAVDAVLVGGFSEFIEKYFETMCDLAQSGISVWCLDWRGQGGSERNLLQPSRPCARDFDADARDLAAFINAVLPRAALSADGSKTGRRLLIAHSMGAAIAVLALHQDPGLVDAAALSAPMLEINTGLPHVIARGLAWLASRLGCSNLFLPGTGPWKFDQGLTADTSPVSQDADRCLVQRTWFEARPRLRVDGPTYGWLNAAFHLTSRFKAAGFLEAVRTPILLGSAGRERFVSPRIHRRAAKRLTCCRLVEFAQAKHELFMEADVYRQPWLAEIEAFGTAGPQHPADVRDAHGAAP